ncbi:hypothetical protein [Geomonas azotofigens]|uniref:hypothetical protein n=1 Tax=Geomonas azotofigens TaxID=2843196 RepID=UPI001C112B25|nr:hypothetical protein [Geomonas azotofigens]MBU5613604.1 hypothetical protein [Geomonas azotofigens]
MVPLKSLRMLSCFAMTSALLAGCPENFTLISRGIEGRSPCEWVKFTPPKDPDKPQEIAALEAAQGLCTISRDGVDAMYVNSDAGCQLVAVVEQAHEGADWLTPRRVVRYRVEGGKIVARTVPSVEVFPDVQFERAVILTAHKANSLDPVTLYEGGKLRVSMTARPLSRCSATVRIFDQDLNDRRPVAEKVVDFCR